MRWIATTGALMMALGIVVSGCGTSNKLKEKDVEKYVKSSLETVPTLKTATISKVDCPKDITYEKGKTFTCQVDVKTAAGEMVTFDLTEKMISEKDNKVTLEPTKFTPRK